MFGRRDLYGNAPYYMVEPEENKRDKNIFGLELECNDREAWDGFSELVHDNIIGIPYNEDEYIRRHVWMAGTNDPTAQFELVFQAERPRNLLLGLKAVNTELSPNTVNNVNGQGDCDGECDYCEGCGMRVEEDSSAHIHINNRYLENKGIDYRKISEFGELFAPALYTMSGRIDTEESLGWAKSRIRNKCEILDHPAKRAKVISERSSSLTHGSRYHIVNTPTDHGTTEIRIFSNTCSFDYERIHLFIDTANFLIDIADKYQEEDIGKCYQDALGDFKDFMTNNRRRKREARRLGMEFFWSDAKEYYKHISRRGYRSNKSILCEMDALTTLRDLELYYNITYDGTIELGNIDIEEIENFIEDNVGYYEYLLL